MVNQGAFRCPSGLLDAPCEASIPHPGARPMVPEPEMSAATPRSAPPRGPASSPSPPESALWRVEARHGPAAVRGQEWLLTNGLGGFAMGTAAGVPTRRYHAMLIAATHPPVGRIAALNAMVEQVELGGRSFEYASFEFNGRPEPVLHPAGFANLTAFEFGDLARWTFASPGVIFIRELILTAGTNSARLRYRIRRSADSLRQRGALRVRPLVSLRDFHALIRRAWADDFKVEAHPSSTTVVRSGHSLHFETESPDAAFTRDEQWWYDFFYREDADRGQDCIEDLFSPGEFELPLSPGVAETTFELLVTINSESVRPPGSFTHELQRRRDRATELARAATPAGAAPETASAIGLLARASDAFVVARRDARGGLAGVSTIAGYPWFSDWGRDTFIALDGLLLATGRFDEARRELESFAAARRNGIIPNVFNDRTGEPEFNTVDASLWFIHAACRYLEESRDRAGFESVLLDACLDVVQHYRRGTDFNIAMDPIDKLITAGTNATQLTWMDARRDGVTFTPRHGKAVEINALWYSALRALGRAAGPARGTLAADLSDLAGAVGRSFAAKFWNAQRRCLYDCLTPGEGSGWIPDDSIRPNQLLAISLPHSALSPEQQRGVLECLRPRLLTPMGIRTLDPADPRYRPRYRGLLFERDAAYHQGTAWPWLLGPFAEAVLRIGSFSREAKAEALSLLLPIISSLETGERTPRPGTCLGQIAEVYDGGGDGPETQRAGGCPAQAWSVAEALRILKLIAA